LLEVDHVTLRFGGVVALDDVDFTLYEGEILGLIGPNGAGKTTFFNVLLGIIDPTDGTVEFSGRQVIARPRRVGLESIVWVAPSILIVLAALALGVTGVLAGSGIALAGVAAMGLLIAMLLLAIVRPVWYQNALVRLGIFRSARPNDMVQAGMARTFQNIRLFKNMTAVENVLIGMHTQMNASLLDGFFSTRRARREEDASDRRAQELLAVVGLRGIGNELAKNLPYGDQRRLEIARALATEPQLLLLDEPAAGMNPAESNNLNGLIQTIRSRGLTVLLIEHHMRVVMGISDRIAVLDYGVKIAEGTPEAVRSNPQVIAAYLGTEEVA
jgi:branched-chain amino acid transport system ATP-binding protein